MRFLRSVRLAGSSQVSSETSGQSHFLGLFTDAPAQIHVRFGGSLRHPLGYSSLIAMRALSNSARVIDSTRWVTPCVTAPRRVERNERNNKKPARCRSCSVPYAVYFTSCCGGSAARTTRSPAQITQEPHCGTCGVCQVPFLMPFILPAVAVAPSQSFCARPAQECGSAHTSVVTVGHRRDAHIFRPRDQPAFLNCLLALRISLLAPPNSLITPENSLFHLAGNFAASL